MLRLFFEYFKISLFVLGGGYAIIAAAEDVFARRLKWLKEGELIDHLPVFQMVPGLIATNSSVYTGLRVAGLPGAVTAVVAVAIPSFTVITIIAHGFASLPLDNVWVVAAFLGLRSSLTALVAGTLVRSWPRIMHGWYDYAFVVITTPLIVFDIFNPAYILVTAIAIGIVREFASIGPRARSTGSVALPLVFLIFLKFGLLCFGGGYVLTPLYISEFVNKLQLMTLSEFGNLLAISQATPGPIGVNAATFFGFRLAGTWGSLVATVALLLPSMVLSTLAIRSLDKWKESRIVRGILGGVAPATISLTLAALVAFARMSVVDESFHVRPLSLLLAIACTYVFLKGKAKIVTLILSCAAIYCLATWICPAAAGCIGAH